MFSFVSSLTSNNSKKPTKTKPRGAEVCDGPFFTLQGFPEHVVTLPGCVGSHTIRAAINRLLEPTALAPDSPCSSTRTLMPSSDDKTAPGRVPWYDTSNLQTLPEVKRSHILYTKEEIHLKSRMSVAQTTPRGIKLPWHAHLASPDRPARLDPVAWPCVDGTGENQLTKYFKD